MAMAQHSQQPVTQAMMLAAQDGPSHMMLMAADKDQSAMSGCGMGGGGNMGEMAGMGDKKGGTNNAMA
jgi:hypothetical protein